MDRSHGTRARRTDPDVTLLSAHDRVRLLRRQSGRRSRARHRSRRNGTGALASAATMEDPRQGRRARQRRDRTSDRLCQQRSARHDARRRRAHVRQALRRAARLARGRCSPTTMARTPMRSRCRLQASRSARSSMRAHVVDGALSRADREPDLPVIGDAAIVAAHGKHRVAAVDVAPLAGGATQRIECDLVCVSGGWNPAVHLFSQARGKLRYDDALAAFVPDASPLPIFPAGAANGCFDLAAALAEGHTAGVAAVDACRNVSASPRAAACRAASQDRHRIAAAAAVVRSRAQQIRQVFRRSAERRDRQRHRARRTRELPVDRASEALHHARHGHRSGQDQQHRRPCR